MDEARAVDIETSSAVQGGVVVAGIAGVLVAAVQGIMAVGHLLALVAVGDTANDPASLSTGQVLRAVGLAASNVALACVCLLAIALAVRQGRAGRVPWVGLGIVAAVAGLTAAGLTWHGDSI